MPLPTRAETFTLQNARAMANDAPAFLLDTARKLGPVFRVGVGPITLTIVSEPQALQHVLQKRAQAWGRGTAIDGIRPLLGNGLPLSDPPLWLTQRRTMQPAFHKSNGPKWVELIQEATIGTLNALKPGESVVTRRLMMLITRDVIVRAMFSHSLGDEVHRIDEAFQVIEDFVAGLAVRPVHLPLWMPTPLHQRFKKAVTYLDARLQALIDERRTQADPPMDLLTMLLRAKDPETGQHMSDRQLRDEVMNIFFAGHETTANLLTWVVYLLHQHPEAKQRAIAEVDSVVGQRALTSEDAAKLPWIGAVLRETLRLYPPAWLFARQALEDDAVQDTPMKKGEVVLVLPYLTHHLAENWERPDVFDPSRFLTETSTDAATWKYRYLPFGAGPHVCIGNHFALLEATVVLAMLLQRGTLELTAPNAVKPKVGATLGVADGLPAVFQQRVTAAAS